jgi:hypothetical protein
MKVYYSVSEICRALNAPISQVTKALKVGDIHPNFQRANLLLFDNSALDRVREVLENIASERTLRNTEMAMKVISKLQRDAWRTEWSGVGAWDERSHWLNCCGDHERREPSNFIREYERKDRLKQWAAKRNANPKHRMRSALSRRLALVMGGKLGRGLMSYVGCTNDQLRGYIESLFEPGMSWDNYGLIWQVDHVLPVSRFDHSDMNQVRICWNWQNLRPMWSDENLAKSDKITEPQQPLPLSFA